MQIAHRFRHSGSVITHALSCSVPAHLVQVVRVNGEVMDGDIDKLWRAVKSVPLGDAIELVVLHPPLRSFLKTLDVTGLFVSAYCSRCPVGALT